VARIRLARLQLARMQLARMRRRMHRRRRTGTEALVRGEQAAYTLAEIEHGWRDGSTKLAGRSLNGRVHRARPTKAPTPSTNPSLRGPPHPRRGPVRRGCSQFGRLRRPLGRSCRCTREVSLLRRAGDVLRRTILRSPRPIGRLSSRWHVPFYTAPGTNPFGRVHSLAAGREAIHPGPPPPFRSTPT
jgi:hypothetical protein